MYETAQAPTMTAPEDLLIHVIDDGRYPSPTSWPPVRINRFAMDGNRIDRLIVTDISDKETAGQTEFVG